MSVEVRKSWGILLTSWKNLRGPTERTLPRGKSHLPLVSLTFRQQMPTKATCPLFSHLSPSLPPRPRGVNKQSCAHRSFDTIASVRSLALQASAAGKPAAG